MQRRLAAKRYTSSRYSDAQRRAIFANLALKHQGLVVRTAGPYIRKFPHLREDLISAGNIGLLEFAKRYNPKRSKFSTGATQAIRARVQREVFKEQTVKVPEKAVRKVASKGPLPSKVDLQDIVGMSTPGSIGQAEARVHLSQLMKRLSPTERRVIMMRGQQLPLRTVGRRLRVSSNRVLKIHKGALAKLQAAN